MSWNAGKLLELMARNEEKVAELYKTLAKNANYGEKFFLNMAEDETRHAHMYRKLIKDHENTLQIDIDEEDKEYMDLLLQNDLFNDADALLEKVTHMNDRGEVLNLCERVERDAVMYVSEIIRLLPEVAPKEMKVVLQEEKKHLKMIMLKKSERSIFGIGM